MATTTFKESNGEPTFFHSVDWAKAAQAGLIVGLILYLVSRGIPWVGSGMIHPNIMGREVAPSQEGTPMLSLGFLVIHLLVSMVYALIIAPIVNGLRPVVAGLAGGVVGLILYFLNYAVFGFLFEEAPGQGEWIVVILHLAFGVIVAETYKGMSRMRGEMPV